MWKSPREKKAPQVLALGYYWPTMKKDSEELVKTNYECQVLGNSIHTHLNMLQDMTTPSPFHTYGLDLIGPINPPSNGHIWILATTEQFIKLVEAIPLKKATRAVVSNFICEHIINRFGVPRRLISDNGKFHTHSFKCVPRYDYSMALPYLGSRSYRTYQPPF